MCEVLKSFLLFPQYLQSLSEIGRICVKFIQVQSESLRIEWIHNFTMSTPKSNSSVLQIGRNNHQSLKGGPEIKWHHFSFWIPERLQWLHFREGQLENNRDNINTKVTKQLIQDATINVHNEVEIELTDVETKDNYIGLGST